MIATFIKSLSRSRSKQKLGTCTDGSFQPLDQAMYGEQNIAKLRNGAQVMQWGCGTVKNHAQFGGRVGFRALIPTAVPERCRLLMDSTVPRYIGRLSRRATPT